MRSYFAGERQRPAVEAALGALERVEWRELGSELEAALEELRLLRELRPPANARGHAPDRHAYLGRRGLALDCHGGADGWGPLRSRSLACRATQALDGFEGDAPAGHCPALRARMRRLAQTSASRTPPGFATASARSRRPLPRCAELARLRALRVCLLVPALEPGFQRAVFVAGGRVAAVRSLPREAAACSRSRRVLAAAAAASVSLAPEDADELLLVASFLRRPPPELRVVDLAVASILAA